MPDTHCMLYRFTWLHAEVADLNNYYEIVLTDLREELEDVLEEEVVVLWQLIVK